MFANTICSIVSKTRATTLIKLSINAVKSPYNVSKTINLCPPTGTRPPTEYGLIYTPNDPNLAPKIAFYRVSDSNPDELQYSLNWGETWVDQSQYITWTSDDVIGTISSEQQLETIVDQIDFPVDFAVPSIGDIGVVTLKPFDQFEHGQMLISSYNPSWSLNSEGIFGNVTDCPTINGIEVEGNCDISAVGDTTTTQIDVTKYVG